MPKINVLSKEIADLIAAGEVVERPSSVVKELLENAVDAGATQIVLEIRSGGKSYIRVTDNGCGIAREDVRTAFLSHATSKITAAQQLDSISSLGFRGEALASICAVSRTELLTRTSSEETGTRFAIEGGVETVFDDAGCPVGSTIVVRDLFYNVPARMKFLKKDVTEGNYIGDVAQRLSLSHPEIAFRFVRDGKTAFSAGGDGDLLGVIGSLFGRGLCSELAAVEHNANGIGVKGYASLPLYCKGSRGLQYFFVNGRTVKSPMVIAALEAAYKDSRMVGKFPAGVLFITLPFDCVDVNVHPAKTEVRFQDERRVFDCVYAAVKNAVIDADILRGNTGMAESKIFAPSPITGEQLNRAFTPSQSVQNSPVSNEDSSPETVPVQVKITEYGTPVTGRVDILRSPDDEEPELSLPPRTRIPDVPRVIPVDTGVESTDEPELTLPPRTQHSEVSRVITVDLGVDSKSESESVSPTTPTQTDVQTQSQSVEESEIRLLGEAYGVFVFCECNGELFVVDKHAAHERIIYNELKSGGEGSAPQMLLVPINVRLSPEEHGAILSSSEMLLGAGYEVEDFGDSTVCVRSCPVAVCGDDISAAVCELASQLALMVKLPVPERLDAVFHYTACRSAIKAGDSSQPCELEALLKRIFSDTEVRYCPHGRPVVVPLKRSELEKLFKRI